MIEINLKKSTIIYPIEYAFLTSKRQNYDISLKVTGHFFCN